MKFPRYYLVVCVIVFQVLLILGLAFSQQLKIQNGVEMYFKLEPRDPRDPFRGDYVELRYEINTVKFTRYSSYPEVPKVGEEVYVSLYNYSNDRDGWEVQGVDKSFTDFPLDDIMHIKGIVK